MLFPAFLLFILFLLLSAFFSSSETSFIAASPYRLDYLEKKGSKRAKLVKRMMKKVDHLLATILIGNTLVNAGAASIATFIFVTFIPNKNQAVLLATLVTTFLILILSEVTPKTYAAYNPIKLSFLFARPIRFFVVIFYPFVKIFTFVARLLVPSSQTREATLARAINEEEIKVLLSMGIKGMSSLRRKMISGALDIGSRPIREVMIPRPQIKAIEITSSNQFILDTIQTAGFSRFPVYKGRLDNIEGVIHAKDVIPYLIDNKEIKLDSLLRKPLFLPEVASLERALLQMQATANHIVFVVDEFGSMEGIVTLEDIIEEIVGEIRDEYDAKEEDFYVQIDENVYVIRGAASIKDINQRLSLALPEKSEYTTLAGFFLHEFGKIPREGDALNYKDLQFVAERMSRHRISLLRVIRKTVEKRNENENHSDE